MNSSPESIFQMPELRKQEKYIIKKTHLSVGRSWGRKRTNVPGSVPHCNRERYPQTRGFQQISCWAF